MAFNKKKTYALHPEGLWKATIQEIEDGVMSKAGNEMVVITYTTNADFKYGLKDYILKESQYKKPQEHKQAFMDALSIKPGDKPDLVGKELDVYVGHDGTWTRIKYKGEEGFPSDNQTGGIDESTIPF